MNKLQISDYLDAILLNYKTAEEKIGFLKLLKAVSIDYEVQKQCFLKIEELSGKLRSQG